MAETERRGVTIHFEESGEGPPVVLLHSYLCSGAMWREQVPVLANHYRVINVDLPGHGRSGPVAAPVTLSDLVADACAVLDAVGVAKAAWAGLSIGGMIALHAALDRPDRVSSLLLFDTHAGSERALPSIKYRAMALGVRLIGWRPFLPSVLALMFGKTTLRENRPLVDEWSAKMAEVDIPCALRFVDLLIGRPSIVDRLPSIRQPALVAVGEEDRSLPVGLSMQIDAGLPDSELLVIEKAGHLSALEQPEAVSRAMLEFLDRVSV